MAALFYGKTKFMMAMARKRRCSESCFSFAYFFE